MTDTNLDPAYLSTLSPEALIDLVTSTQAKLDAIKANKPKREPKPKTEDQLAKEAKRAEFETVHLEDEGTLTRLIQDADRFNQVDAASKLIRALPYDRVARIVADLVTEVAEVEGRDSFDVAREALVRKARAKKSEAAAVDDAVTEAADAEADSTDA